MGAPRWVCSAVKEWRYGTVVQYSWSPRVEQPARVAWVPVLRVDRAVEGSQYLSLEVPAGGNVEHGKLP